MPLYALHTTRGGTFVTNKGARSVIELSAKDIKTVQKLAQRHLGIVYS